MTDNTEEWRPIAGQEGFYEVSNLGRIRSIDRTVPRSDGTARQHVGQVLTPYAEPRRGYLLVNLRGKTHGVHREVARAFLPKPAGKVEVCHNDGDPSNNAVTNLRWDTRQGNVDDVKRHGTMSRGSAHPVARITEDDVRAIRAARERGLTQEAIAADFGVSRSTISAILIGRTWTHV